MLEGGDEDGDGDGDGKDDMSKVNGRRPAKTKGGGGVLRTSVPTRGKALAGASGPSSTVVKGG